MVAIGRAGDAMAVIGMAGNGHFPSVFKIHRDALPGLEFAKEETRRFRHLRTASSPPFSFADGACSEPSPRESLMMVIGPIS